MIPSCIYTHPEIASVGRRYAEGENLVTGEALFLGNGLAVVSGRTEGGVRLVAERESGRLAGAFLAGAHVTEMVGLLGVLIASGVTVDQLRRTTFPHPTMAETVREAAQELACRS